MSTTATTRSSACGGSGRRLTTSRRDGSWSSRRTTTRSATAHSATGCPSPRAAAGCLLRPAVAVRAAAVHGRGVRRDRPISVLLRPHRQADRRRHPRGPQARVRRVRRVRRGGSRPAGSWPRSSAPSSPAGATRRWPASTRSCWPRGAGCRRATPTRSSSTRPPGGCAYGGARSRSSATSPRAPRRPVRGDQRRAVHPRSAADRRRRAELAAMSGALIA